MLQLFPGDSVVKNPPANAGDARDAGSIPGLGRFPGVGNDKLLQYSCLENFLDRRAWQVTVHGVTKGHNLATKEQQCMSTFGAGWGWVRREVGRLQAAV